MHLLNPLNQSSNWLESLFRHHLEGFIGFTPTGGHALARTPAEETKKVYVSEEEEAFLTCSPCMASSLTRDNLPQHVSLFPPLTTFFFL